MIGRMDLENSTEPLRNIATIVYVILGAVGVALTSLAGTVDWSWVPVATTAVAAAAGIVAHLVGTEKARTVVTPEPHVQARIATALATAPQVDAEPPDLDAAVQAAGLG